MYRREITSWRDYDPSEWPRGGWIMDGSDDSDTDSDRFGFRPSSDYSDQDDNDWLVTCYGWGPCDFYDLKKYVGGVLVARVPTSHELPKHVQMAMIHYLARVLVQRVPDEAATARETLQNEGDDKPLFDLIQQQMIDEGFQMRERMDVFRLAMRALEMIRNDALYNEPASDGEEENGDSGSDASSDDWTHLQPDVHPMDEGGDPAWLAGICGQEYYTSIRALDSGDYRFLTRSSRWPIVFNLASSANHFQCANALVLGPPVVQFHHLVLQQPITMDANAIRWHLDPTWSSQRWLKGVSGISKDEEAHKLQEIAIFTRNDSYISTQVVDGMHVLIAAALTGQGRTVGPATARRAMLEEFTARYVAWAPCATRFAVSSNTHPCLFIFTAPTLDGESARLEHVIFTAQSTYAVAFHPRDRSVFAVSNRHGFVQIIDIDAYDPLRVEVPKGRTLDEAAAAWSDDTISDLVLEASKYPREIVPVWHRSTSCQTNGLQWSLDGQLLYIATNDRVLVYQFNRPPSLFDMIARRLPVEDAEVMADACRHRFLAATVGMEAKFRH
ncbi:hypothetical protein GGF32_005093 [Allomyces javanicus]|nr:hypothetical protein GGF32_005093 [Allomyces javanicus]